MQLRKQQKKTEKEIASKAPSSTAETEAGSDDSAAETQATSTGAVVVYFSGTGNTEAVAQQISQILNVPLLKIEPTEPYTDDDLNYNDDNCRANREQQDESVRPAIANDLSEIVNYETIYLGYPIWWGTAPRIMDTFLETYDLSGKTVYAFCTSGESGIETSISELEKVSGINIVSGHRFSAGVSGADVKTWLDSLH